MDVTPPKDPYVVSRRDNGRKIVHVFDFGIGDTLVVLLHLCRTFPVTITCPVDADNDKVGSKTLGFLWIPLGEKAELDRKMREDPKITWEFVCVDLFNGKGCAFYRDRARKAISVDAVAERYFTESNRKFQDC